jgi:hypothetical protein
MQRYYFNLKDGRTVLDKEGTEFPDIHAARREAVRYGGEILRDGADESLWKSEPWRLWVTDQPNGEGKTFFALNFSAEAGD